MEGKRICQPWLSSLMNAKFYDTCNCAKTNRAYFCLDCLGLAFCQICDRTKKHDGHKVIRAMRATNQAGMEMNVIGKLVDICNIQPYSINSKHIVYINQKRTMVQTNQKRSGDNQCQRCGCRIDNGRFCSIECKVKSQAELQEDVIVAAADGTSPTNKKRTFQAPPNSYRKRSRKGIPIRSPLM